MHVATCIHVPVLDLVRKSLVKQNSNLLVDIMFDFNLVTMTYMNNIPYEQS